MEVIWLAPLAWIGGLTALAPVLIHLLTKPQATRVPFPTLRFIHTTRLAALGRRSIQEWWLLATRFAILAMAAAALAAPVFVSTERRNLWQSRVVSAVVVAPSTTVDRSQQDALIAAERAGSFTSAVFTPASHLADGLRDAARWLDLQPPGTREVVIVGDLRAGHVSAPDLALVPVDAAIRFLPFSTGGVDRSAALELTQGATRWRVEMSLLDESTRVAYMPAPAREVPIRVRARDDDQPFAAAALEAVLARGLRAPEGRRVLVVFDGADIRDLQPIVAAGESWMREALAALPQTTGGQLGDTLVVRVPRRAEGVEALHLLEQVARIAFAEDLRALEPTPIAPDVLERWSRPASPSGTFRPSYEGDGRWFWGAALLLLALEAALRRSQRTDRAQPAPAAEERVA